MDVASVSVGVASNVARVATGKNLARLHSWVRKTNQDVRSTEQLAWQSNTSLSARAALIGHSVVNGWSVPTATAFVRSCVGQAQRRRDGPRH